MTDTGLEPAGNPAQAQVRSRRRAVPEWLLALGVGLIGAVVYTIPYLQNRYFYYVGDAPESYLPLWHHFGELLRAGQWPTMEPSSWYGGQYAAESATAMWNPVALGTYVIVSHYDDLAAASATIMVGYLAILAIATFLLAREYGAGRVPAAVVGLAIPAAGFTLYYEAAGWPGNLMAFTWVTWFWWGARRHARGASSPLLPFVLGLMAMTTGNPYAALGVLIVTFGIGVELLVRRAYRRLVHLVVVGACVGASGALVFLPLVGTLEVSARQELAMIANDTFMVPDLGDLAGASSPTYLPSILNWNGAVLETLPSTYFAWFVIPLLPWLRWSSLRRLERPLVSLGVIVGVYAAMVLGPSNFWLFRWPIRLIEYLYVGLAVLFAVLLSAGLARDRFRERMLATAALVGFGAYLSSAVRPELYRMHLVAALAVLVLIVGVVLAYRRRGWVAAGAVLVIGTIGVITYQSSRIPLRGPEGFAVEPPRSVSRIEAGTESYRGAVLQLATQTGVRTTDMDDGEILFGNLSRATGQEWLTRYSGIGFARFTSALCMDYKGVVCPDAYRRLWQPYDGTGSLLIDAMRVETLVLQNDLLPYLAEQPPPPGWQVLLSDDVRTVWIRTEPLPFPGRVSAVSDGIEVLGSEAESERERVTFRASGDGGAIVFARLNWPGYTATIDGEPVQTRIEYAGLLEVPVPPGEHVLELEYRSPGLRLGAWVLVGAAGVVLLQTVVWWLTGRRSARDRGTEPVAEEPAEPGAEPQSPVLSHAGSHPDRND